MAEDARLLWEAAGRPRTLEEVCPQRFGEPLAPPQAAAAEGARVDVERLREGAACWQQGFEVLVVEGAGGLFSPLADGVLNVDLARQLDATLIVVAANRLGAIHQAVATCAAAARHGLVPYGVILCNPSGRADGSRVGNAAQIARYCESPVLATVPFGGDERHVSFVEQWLGPPD
jgi:dethiobiotin synthetase